VLGGAIIYRAMRGDLGAEEKKAKKRSSSQGRATDHKIAEDLGYRSWQEGGLHPKTHPAAADPTASGREQS